MDRYWARIDNKILFTLQNSQYKLWSVDGDIPHPWDMDCIYEQLAAQEAGLA